MRDAVRMSTTAGMPTHDLISSYVLAKGEVVRAGYVDEIAWQGNARLIDVDTVAFMREAAWVVLSTGMAERVVRGKFPALAEVLHGWDPVAISKDAGASGRALGVFGHRRKVAAILDIARVAAALDRESLHAALTGDPKRFLTDLPYVGPVTWTHLAKNLGLPLAKPDRHLVRLSAAYRRDSVADLCEEIAVWLGEPVAVVDVVLWRYGSLHAQRCRLRACGGLPHALAAHPLPIS